MEVIINWLEAEDSGMSLEWVTCVEEGSPCNKLPDNEKRQVLFTDGSHCIVGKH